MPGGDSYVTIKADHFKLAGQKALEGARKGVAAICFAIQEQAQVNIRDNGSIDTGSMLNSAYVETSTQSGRAEAIGKAAGASASATIADQGTPITEPAQGKVAFCVEHAIYVEFGTVNAAEKPYLGPAVEEIKPKAAKVLGQFIHDEVK
jgi:hypothetical protein